MNWLDEEENLLAKNVPSAGDVFDDSELVFLMEYGRHSSRFVELESSNGNQNAPLTNLGLVKAFNRGQYLRETYPNFLEHISLPENSDRVYFKSTNTSRTITVSYTHLTLPTIYSV